MSKAVRRYVLLPLGILYLATWIWGIPMVHTRIANDVIHSYKNYLSYERRDRVEHSMVSERHPYMCFGASYAILPLVTVNHYECQVAGGVGWGGFTVDVWYFAGSKRILSFTKWVS